MKLYISLIVVQLLRATRRTLLLQKTRHPDNEENLATNLARTLGSGHRKINLLRLKLSALPVTNATTLRTVGTSTMNRHLSGGRQTNMWNYSLK
jgi:hypothetical protein